MATLSQYLKRVKRFFHSSSWPVFFILKTLALRVRLRDTLLTMRNMLLALLLVIPVGLHGQDLRNMAADLQSTSVTIDAKGGYGSGSVIIDEIGGIRVGLFLTAAHVVDSLRKIKHYVSESGESETTIEFEDAYVITDITVNGRIVGQKRVAAEVIYYSDADNGHDVAVLLSRKPPHKDQKSTKFYLGGEIPYPGTSIMHVGSFLGPPGSGSFSEGLVSKNGRIVGMNYYDQGSCTHFHGSSGGGVFNDKGEFIGMLVRTWGPNFSLFSPIRRLHTWSKEAKMEWLFDPSKPKPTISELKTLKYEGIDITKDSMTGQMRFTRPDFESKYELSDNGRHFHSFLIKLKDEETEELLP